LRLYTNGRKYENTMKGGDTNTMKKGFTLIELLVVIAIIGILSAIGLVSLNGAREKARDAQGKSDLGQARTALTLYSDDNGGLYPQTDLAPAASCAGADDSATVDGVWDDPDGVLIPEYLSKTLTAPTTAGGRDYFYCANQGGGATKATSYVLYYLLETGNGANHYMIFNNGDVIDYADGENTAPNCPLGGTCVVT
jgi:prepilin-type N-terminal cleavage/methylation domain-containing protein